MNSDVTGLREILKVGGVGALRDQKTKGANLKQEIDDLAIKRTTPADYEGARKICRSLSIPEIGEE